MAFGRIKLISLAALTVAGGMGYYLYSATAQVAAPQLAQAPLNTTRTITPAFIMAVDDSGSMDFEMLFPTNDGAAWWNRANNSFIGLDRNDNPAVGVMNFNRAGGANDSTWKKVAYVFPLAGAGDNEGRANGDATNDHFAIPPFPAYGYARSPDINRAYFEPTDVYQPWLQSDGQFLQGVSGIDGATGQVSPTQAPLDPKRGSTRIDLTTEIALSGTNNRFMLFPTMAIPAGIQYRDINCANGGSLSTGNDTSTGNWYTARSIRTVAGNDGRSRCGVAIKYYAPTFYVLSTRASDVAAAIGYSTSAIVDDGAKAPDGRALRKFEIRLRNFADTGDYTRTINNFANWFSYYRKRHAAARAGLSRAFADQNLKIRAGYFTINSRNTVTMRSMNVAADRQALYNDMFALRSNGGTPNKEAVEFMGQQFKRPYAEGVSPVQLSCQKNYGMLFTDGFSNNSTPRNTNEDNSDATVFPVPLKDATANTMADLAAYYYKNSLGTSYPPVGGKVPVPEACSAANPDPRLDCQIVPHMNLYGVTLGARGLVFGDPAYQAQNDDPYANPPSWPTAFYDRHPSAVDDLWHATMNARGRFINAASSGALVRAIEEVVQAVTAGASTSGSIALTGSRVGTGSLTVQPFYEAVNSTDWYGQLTASRVAATGSAVSYTTLWEASAELPAPADRNIHFGSTTDSVVPTVRTFTTANLGLAGISDLAGLCTDSLSPASCTAANLGALRVGTDATSAAVSMDQAVAFLRGDTTLEGTALRDRTGPLGDIINSSPVVSAPIDDYGYRSLGGSLGSTYASYLTAKAQAGRSMVFVGANDGMFHVFNGATGKETYAYIPATSVSHMGNLLFPRNPDPNGGQKFDHRYYVDGPIAVSDAYIDGSWRTIVVGTSGAGGRSVFALDVTDPDAISILWEINDRITGNDDIRDGIGYVLGKPVIVPTKAADGTVAWKAIFGNGYNSADQVAKLFVVDLATGATSMIAAEETASSANDVASYNGLGNIVVLDRVTQRSSGNVAGRDGYADTVYAGDQNGALWKFDLLSSSVALDGVPLFVARDSMGRRQPITGGLEAAAGIGGSVMVYFGTGAFAFEGDANSVNPQTIYGIADRGVAITGRSSLLQQTMGSVSGDYRATSTNSMTALYSGWYLDLPAGQRVIGSPRVESGTIFIPAYEPSNSAGNPCEPDGVNWLYGLNSISGAAALTNVRVGSPDGSQPASTAGGIKLNTSGSAPVTDIAVLTTARVGPVANSHDLEDALDARCSMVVQAPGAQPLYLPRPCGRQSWRQVR
ncbi:pilus assembly protein [[Pseudomonas] boreopolis]|uniref:pilus assembly protein n=1 Tax=Xanthomonas boreopolis TaxID=86183 RepID=UPI003D9AC70F